MIKNSLIFTILICLILVSCTSSQPDIITHESKTIVSTAPSNTEILIALGLGDSLLAVDTFSVDILGVNSDAKVIDTASQDLEVLLLLKPDIIIASEINQINGMEDPYKILKELGTQVVYIQTSKTLEDIYTSIQEIAQITDTENKSIEIINNMKNEVDKVLSISQNINDKKTVYFEIDASLFTFGSGTFLHDLVEKAGGINIFESENGWFSTNEEVILNVNPDVILTNVNYIDNYVDNIKLREYWASVKAVINDEVYYIDANSSSRPSHNSIKALVEISKALYPQYYE